MNKCQIRVQSSGRLCLKRTCFFFLFLFVFNLYVLSVKCCFRDDLCFFVTLIWWWNHKYMTATLTLGSQRRPRPVCRSDARPRFTRAPGHCMCVTVCVWLYVCDCDAVGLCGQDKIRNFNTLLISNCPCTLCAQDQIRLGTLILCWSQPSPQAAPTPSPHLNLLLRLNSTCLSHRDPNPNPNPNPDLPDLNQPQPSWPWP